MTYNTKIEIDRLRAEIKRLIEKVEKEQAEHAEMIAKLKEEFGEVLQSQREEIMRLKIELERVHIADRHRRILAKRYLEK